MDWIAEIVDPERRLALAYAPRARRQGLAALWVLDERLGAIVAATREAMLGEIRLAWWRDALAALAQGGPAGEPLLEYLAGTVRDDQLSPAELARLPEGWTTLLAPMPLEQPALLAHAAERGGALFGLSATLLKTPGDGVEDAGAAWALLDLAARISDPVTAGAARALAGERLVRLKHPRWPRSLRALAVLTALARHDLHMNRPRRQGSPRRLFVAIRAGLTGR